VPRSKLELEDLRSETEPKTLGRQLEKKAWTLVGRGRGGRRARVYVSLAKRCQTRSATRPQRILPPPSPGVDTRETAAPRRPVTLVYDHESADLSRPAGAGAARECRPQEWMELARQLYCVPTAVEARTTRGRTR